MFSQLHFRTQTKDVSSRRNKIGKYTAKKINLMIDDSHGHVKEIGVSPGNDGKLNMVDSSWNTT